MIERIKAWFRADDVSNEAGAAYVVSAIRYAGVFYMIAMIIIALLQW